MTGKECEVRNEMPGARPIGNEGDVQLILPVVSHFVSLRRCIRTGNGGNDGPGQKKVVAMLLVCIVHWPFWPLHSVSKHLSGSVKQLNL